MQLFVCWSGDRGRLLAEILKDHLTQIVRGLDVFVSTDIPKGALWFEAVSDALQASGAGLICLTSDSLHSPWIHYEAGALARSFPGEQGRIYTYLVEVAPRDLTGPLSAYQSTAATPGDTRKLIESLIQSMPKAEQQETVGWEAAFEYHWPRLDEAISNIRSREIQAIFPKVQDLFRRKSFDEPLTECTAQSWIDRYNGARDTLLELRRHADRVATEANRFVADAYTELIGEVDGYVMNLGLMIEEQRYPLGDDGRVLLPAGVETACEARRIAIKRLVSTLVDPVQAPVFGEALRFERAETFEEKKNLIHRNVASLRVDRLGSALDELLRRAAESEWAFDRIVRYRYLSGRFGGQKESREDLSSALHDLDTELEKARARGDGVSLMPLYYALRLVKVAAGTASIPAQVRGGMSARLVEIDEFVDQDSRRDQGGEVRRLVDDLRSLAAERTARRTSPRGDARRARSPRRG
jgi:hypothetical protein